MFLCSWGRRQGAVSLSLMEVLYWILWEISILFSKEVKPDENSKNSEGGFLSHNTSFGCDDYLDFYGTIIYSLPLTLPFLYFVLVIPSSAQCLQLTALRDLLGGGGRSGDYMGLNLGRPLSRKEFYSLYCHCCPIPMFCFCFNRASGFIWQWSGSTTAQWSLLEEDEIPYTVLRIKTQVVHKQYKGLQ